MPQISVNSPEGGYQQARCVGVGLKGLRLAMAVIVDIQPHQIPNCVSPDVIKKTIDEG
jgi:hypothetical protein